MLLKGCSKVALKALKPNQKLLNSIVAQKLLKSRSYLNSNLLISALANAPPYCSKHRVTSQGWNYPAPSSASRGEDAMEREFTADLSTQLVYQPPPEGRFPKCSNTPLSQNRTLLNQ
jgi:hypothetical protein